MEVGRGLFFSRFWSYLVVIAKHLKIKRYLFCKNKMSFWDALQFHTSLPKKVYVLKFCDMMPQNYFITVQGVTAKSAHLFYIAMQ